MSDLVLIRWSKRATITAGVLWPLVLGIVLFIGVLTGAIEDVEPMGPRGILGLATAFYVPAIVLMFALAGVCARYKEQWRAFGQIGLIFALIALVILPISGAEAMGSGQISPMAPMEEAAILAVVLGSTILGIGFVLFGLAAVRTDTPSRQFGGILIGVGLFQPLILLAPDGFNVIAYSLGWLVLGWVLPAAKENAPQPGGAA